MKKIKFLSLLLFILLMSGCTQPTKFTVEFQDYDGSIISTQQVMRYYAAKAPDNPIRDGYNFTGWDCKFNHITDNLVVKATYDIKKYTVKFLDHRNEELKVEEVSHGSFATPPSAPDVIGWEFIGWDTSFDEVSSDLIIKPLYAENRLTVIFIDYNGDELKTELVDYGSDATPPIAPPCLGHTFIRWDQDFKQVTSNLTIRAVYEINKYLVKFMDGKNELKSQLVEYGKDATPPNLNIPIGYSFKEWDHDYKNITNNLTINVKYDLINYQIIFNANVKTTTATWDSKNDFLNEFYSDLFQWLNNHYLSINEITKNGTQFTMTKNGLTASWSNASELRAVNIYDFERTIGTLIYKPFNRLINEPVTMVEDSNYFLNTEPYRSKYADLDRYFLNVINKSYSSYDKGYQHASNGRVQIFFRFQQWNQGTNIPTFDLLPVKYIQASNQITIPNNISYTIEDEIILPLPSYENIYFLGWFSHPLGAGKPITHFEKGTYNTLNLYAIWDFDLEHHEVIFIDDLGNIIDKKIVISGETITPPNVIPKLGYKFIGWDKDISNITGDLTVTVKYEKEIYTIEYNKNIDSENVILPNGPMFYTITDLFTLPKASLDSYLFLGWYDNESCFGEPITNTSFGNLVLYARWLRIPDPDTVIGDGTITIVSSDEILQIGRYSNLYVKAGNSYLNSNQVKFISSNEEVVEVDNDGFLKPKTAGTVYIIAIRNNDLASIKLTVESPSYQVKWIGHQGAGGPHVQNTVLAFEEGGRRNYYALECDVRVSSDGVYYICHDDVFLSTLFVDSSLYNKPMAGYTWNQLKDLQLKRTVSGTTYYGYLTTVEEYLNICKQYGTKAILELKWTNGINSNDQSKLSGLVELVKQCGMYENAIFMTSMKNCLTFLRTNYPDAVCQFLSGETTTTVENINWCIENRFSLDAIHTKITPSIVQTMHDAYLYVNGYTVNNNDIARNLQNYLVDMITTDNLGID